MNCSIFSAVVHSNIEFTYVTRNETKLDCLTDHIRYTMSSSTLIKNNGVSDKNRVINDVPDILESPEDPTLFTPPVTPLQVKEMGVLPSQLMT